MGYQCQTIIDCAGGNPFKKSDYMRQKDLINSIDAKVIMLLADGTDPWKPLIWLKLTQNLALKG